MVAQNWVHAAERASATGAGREALVGLLGSEAEVSH